MEQSQDLMAILQNNSQRFYNECCKIANRDVAEDKEFLTELDVLVNAICKSQGERFKYPSFSQKALADKARRIYG